MRIILSFDCGGRLDYPVYQSMIKLVRECCQAIIQVYCEEFGWWLKSDGWCEIRL